MKNEALYPFGYGLSYTDFEISNVAIDSEEVAKGKNVLCTVNIKNTGSMPGAETIQVYVKVKQEGTPNPQLKGLKKVYLNPGELKTISIELQDKAFGLYDNEGRLVLHEGEYEVFIGISQPDERSISLTGKKPYKKIMRSAQTVIL